MRPLLAQSLASLSAIAKGVTVHSRHAILRTRKLRHCCSPLSARFSHRNLAIQRKTAWKGTGRGSCCVVAETTREKRDREQREKMEEELKDVVVPQFRDVGEDERAGGNAAAPASSDAHAEFQHQDGRIRFKVISYNVLAQVYVRSSLFPHAHNVALRWKRRSKAMALLLSSVGADFLLLQEVDQYEDFYKPIMEANGYGSVYKLRTGHKKDGSAIFYRKDRFELLASQDIEFNDLAPPMTDAEAAEAEAEAAAAASASAAGNGGANESDREGVEDSVRARGEANGKGGRGSGSNNNDNNVTNNYNNDSSRNGSSSSSSSINNNNKDGPSNDASSNGTNDNSGAGTAANSRASSRQPSGHNGAVYPAVAAADVAAPGMRSNEPFWEGADEGLNALPAGPAARTDGGLRTRPDGRTVERPGRSLKPATRQEGPSPVTAASNALAMGLKRAGATTQLGQGRGEGAARGGHGAAEARAPGVDGSSPVEGAAGRGVESAAGAVSASAAAASSTSVATATGGGPVLIGDVAGKGVALGSASGAGVATVVVSAKVEANNAKKVFYNHPRLRWIRDDVAVMAKFASREDPSRVLVLSSSHLFWDPLLDDVKLAQARLLVDRVAHFRDMPTPAIAPLPPVHGRDMDAPGGCEGAGALSGEGAAMMRDGEGAEAAGSGADVSGARRGGQGSNGRNGADVSGGEAGEAERFGAAGDCAIRHPLPVIIGGDFNSKPDSKVYHFLASASESIEEQCTANYDSYVAQPGPVTSPPSSARDPQGVELFPCACIALQSAYGGAEPPFTTYCPDFTGTIDYIWHTGEGTGLRVTKRLQLPVQGEKSLDVGLPNYSHPSDHLPIGAEFELR